MAAHTAKAFGPGETVHLDGQAFFDCEFKEVAMVYSGGEIPAFTGCHFDNCHWQFDGAATRTLGFLRFLHASGNVALIDGIMREIRGS